MSKKGFPSPSIDEMRLANNQSFSEMDIDEDKGDRPLTEEEIKKYTDVHYGRSDFFADPIPPKGWIYHYVSFLTSNGQGSAINAQKLHRLETQEGWRYVPASRHPECNIHSNPTLKEALKDQNEFFKGKIVKVDAILMERPIAVHQFFAKKRQEDARELEEAYRNKDAGLGVTLDTQLSKIHSNVDPALRRFQQSQGFGR